MFVCESTILTPKTFDVVILDMKITKKRKVHKQTKKYLDKKCLLLYMLEMYT